MDKEEKLLKKRMTELAQLCYQRDIPSYTDFLNLNEQTVFHSIVQELPPVRFMLTGGYETAERRVVCFLPSYEDETMVPPISVLKAEPVSRRFAQELTHRDFLGALMNLGIERRLLGDIVINDEGCFLFCLSHMADYIADSLCQVKKTQVRCTAVPAFSCEVTQRYETVGGSIASPRLDNILAMVWKTSRTQILPYIQGEKVFINGRLAASPSVHLKGGEIVSVRGLGKFLYSGVENETKKGRIFVSAKKYK